MKKLLILSAPLISVFMLSSSTYATSTPSPSYAQRAVWVVTASSLTVRSQPTYTAPQVGPTQYSGDNEVQTNINQFSAINDTSGSGYAYWQVDYTNASVGTYSDSYNGYISWSGPNSQQYMDNCLVVTNHTSSSDNIYQYSNLTTVTGSLVVGARTGGTSTGVYAANDNPDAWLVTIPGTQSSYGWINGWYVDGTYN